MSFGVLTFSLIGKGAYELQEYENESPYSLTLLIDKDEMLLSILQSRNISTFSINKVS